MESAGGEEEERTANVHGSTKPVRHRKKMFYRTLRHQMEFYFSDANLSKNRFMGKHLLEDPHVNLSLFLTFNKIRAMTDNVNDIVKALRKSKVLSVTEDGLKVFRTTEINKREEEAKCTIYVEHLPPDAEHEWLRSIFLPYGDVPYISIPKFHLSKMNKGFAFVEFDTPDAANRALEAFGEMGCRLSAQVSPEEICSLVQGEERSEETEADPDRDVFKKPDAKVDIFSNGTVCGESTEVAGSEIGQKRKKRKIDEGEDSEEPVAGGKKAKSEMAENGDGVEDFGDSKEKKRKESTAEVHPEEGEKIGDEEEVQENQENEEGEEDEEEGKKRKSRKHKKKKPKRFEHRVDPKHALRVLSKIEWQSLRTKYVGLQKSKMKALKQQLARSRWVENYSHEPKEQAGHRKDKRQSEPDKPAEKTLKEFTFVPDVIVRVGFKEPAVDIKAFKAVAKTHADVAYVDVSEGATEAFIRCGNAEAASRLVKEQPWSEMSLLDGTCEKDYWEKISRDRDQKVKGNVANFVKRRGKDKLLKKAEKALGKHIRFEKSE